MDFDFDFQDEEQEQGAPAWVVTFGDMMSLLLAFFVLLLSFSEIDRVAFAQIMGSLKNAFGVQTVQIMVHPHEGPERMEVPQDGNASGDGLLDKLHSILPGAFAGGGEGIGEHQDDSRVTISFPGRLLFESGESRIQDPFYETLDVVADFMKKEPNLQLQVFGHTDDRPIFTPRFYDNWELSASRASQVVKYLIAQGVERSRLVSVGFADTRPVAPNDSPQNREKNRRVEFLFIEGYSPGEYEVLGARDAHRFEDGREE
ncbi:MAG TPA: flagellar motor protein MotB [Acidobacteriota bacterium]|nr:flagellar motor protein MotB [Acidobacteriota bacterium]